MINLNTRLATIDWGRNTSRILSVFNKIGVRTLKELLNLKPEELLKQENFGGASLVAVFRILRESGHSVFCEKGRKLGGAYSDEGKICFPWCPHCGKTLRVMFNGDELTVSRRR